MNISPTYTSVSDISASGFIASGKRVNTNSAFRSNELRKSEEIQEMISSAPDIRGNKVEEAKLLIADPSFPSDDVIDKISRLMISNL